MWWLRQSMARARVIATGAVALAMAVTACAGDGSTETEEGAVQIDNVEEHYAGESVEFVINFPAGGSTDVWGRFIAANLVEHIPGAPDLSVSYHPGATGAVGARYFRESAEPDGFTIGVIGGTMPAQQVTAGLADIDVTWGNVILGMSESYVVYGRSDVYPDGYASLMAPTKSPTYYGTGSPLRWAWGYAWWNSLGRSDDYEAVVGYEGTGEQLQAMLSAELDASIIASAAYVQQVRPHVEEGTLEPLFQTGVPGPDGPRRAAGVEDVPLFHEVYEEFVGDPVAADSEYLEFLNWAVNANVSRWLAVPEGTPDVLVEALREAAQEMVQDPEFLSEQAELFGTEDPGFHEQGEELEVTIQNIIDAGDRAGELMAQWLETDGPSF